MRSSMKRILLAFILHFSCLLGAERAVLCVDVGCSRVKAAVLTGPFTIKSLKKTKLLFLSSENWKGEKLPFLLSPNALPQLLNSSYDEISVALSGPIKDHVAFFEDNMNGAPREIKKAFEAQARCPVFIENDAICYLRGAVLWRNIRRKSVRFPCACITLGTWVGCSIAKDLMQIEDIEIGQYDDFTYTRLKNIVPALANTERGFLPSCALGNNFLRFIEENPHIDPQQEYTARLRGFLLDFRDYFQKYKIKTIFVGGGNARFASPHLKITGVQVIVLNDKTFQRYGIPPEMVPLLGCFLTRQELERKQ